MLISNAHCTKTSEIYERILEFIEDRKKLNYFQNKALAFQKNFL